VTGQLFKDNPSVVQRLPVHQLKAVTLVYLVGLSVEEAAERMYCDPCIVRRLCDEAAKNVRRYG
jgi:DNA-directed RNA polymerase specialized sigma24 family protein